MQAGSEPKILRSPSPSTNLDQARYSPSRNLPLLDYSFQVHEKRSKIFTFLIDRLGVTGTPVTITGTNFAPAAANNKSKFNVTYSTISTATSTSIATTVPATGTSGRISISTPAGTAVSNGDFFVPPSPYTVADVASTGRMILGESKNVAFGTDFGERFLPILDSIAELQRDLKSSDIQP